MTIRGCYFFINFNKIDNKTKKRISRCSSLEIEKRYNLIKENPNSIVIIGGMGNLKGSFYASVFMILLPEILRFIGLPSSASANIRQIIYGVILVLVMMNGGKGITSLFQLKKSNN